MQRTAGALGLDEYLERKPAELSGGQRQRVALARAIVRQPEVFLMDEPLSNLDAKLRASTRVELVELQRSLATTVLYVTHDQVEAMTMGDRVAVMNQGRLQQVGSPQEVYDAPANQFVAEFIGTPPMNTFAGCLTDDGTVRIGAGALVAADRPAGGGEVVAGVRPEDFVFDAAGDASGAEGAGLVGTVALLESLGHERHVRVRLDTGVEVTIRQAASEAAPAQGEAVRLRAAPHDVHLFDATTGARLGV